MLKESLLNETNWTEIEKLSLKQFKIEEILQYITTKWEHKSGDFTIQTPLSFVDKKYKKPRTLQITCKGFNDYGIYDDNSYKVVMKKQAQNTITLSIDNLKRMCYDCLVFGKIILFIQNIYKIIVTSCKLLLQILSGKKGAKEAIFGWYRDNVHNQKSCYDNNLAAEQ